MRPIWSQSVRPRGNCSSVSLSSHVPGLLSRKTNSGGLRRRLTFSDAFTIFLTPVLTAAFIADASWKTKKKRDWDKKIAEIHDEIELLHAQEAKAWNSLQIRSVRSGALHLRREYSTNATALAPTDIDYSSNESFSGDFESVSTNEPFPTEESQQWKAFQDTTKSTSDEDVVETFAEQPAQVWEPYDRLIAIQLAIRMILHIHTGSSSRFFNLSDSYPTPTDTSQDLNGLINRLKSLRAYYHSISIPENTYFQRKPKAWTEEGLQLNEQLLNLADSYYSGSLTVVQMVEEFAARLLNSSESPSMKTYQRLLRTFSLRGDTSLAYLTTSAIASSKHPLNEWIVYNILMLYGKNQDVYNLDDFLKNLVKTSGFWNIGQSWEWFRFENINLPIPTSKDTRILSALIYTALKCHQPERAYAWASILKDLDYGGYRKVHVFKSFLGYYAAESDWNGGKEWIKIALQHAQSIASHDFNEFKRLLFRILDLCVICQKQEEYSNVLNAIVESGIEVPRKDDRQAPRFSDRAISILGEWYRLSTSLNLPESSSSDWQKVARFQNLVDAQFFGDSSSVDNQNRSVAARLKHPSSVSTDSPKIESSNRIEAIAQRWEVLFKEQERNLQRLKEELIRSKTLFSSFEDTKARVPAQDRYSEFDWQHTNSEAFAKPLRQERYLQKPIPVDNDSDLAGVQEKESPPHPSRKRHKRSRDMESKNAAEPHPFEAHLVKKYEVSRAVKRDPNSPAPAPVPQTAISIDLPPPSKPSISPSLSQSPIQPQSEPEFPRDPEPESNPLSQSEIMQIRVRKIIPSPEKHYKLCSALDEDTTETNVDEQTEPLEGHTSRTRYAFTKINKEHLGVLGSG